MLLCKRLFSVHIWRNFGGGVHCLPNGILFYWYMQIEGETKIQPILVNFSPIKFNPANYDGKLSDLFHMETWWKMAMLLIFRYKMDKVVFKLLRLKNGGYEISFWILQNSPLTLSYGTNWLVTYTSQDLHAFHFYYFTFGKSQKCV